MYFGVKRFNMRALASNFDTLEIKKLTDFLHGRGRKAYLTLNATLYDKELERARRVLQEAARSGIDAVILSDMGVFHIARECGLKVHLSTQLSVSNFGSFSHYARLGAERIVMARECSLDDIAHVKRRAAEEGLDCRVECFAHGAICSSVSGRCYLSLEVFGRSANRGECLQPCRREYRITDTDGECQFTLGSDYVLSAKDLCTIPVLSRVISAGVDALKIEGRMRSPEYVFKVTSVYRRAIDLHYEGALDEKVKKELFEELGSSSFTRGLSTGFFKGSPQDLGAVVETRYKKMFLGQVRKFYKKISVAEIEIMSGGLKLGDTILIYGKNTPASYSRVESMEIEKRSVKRAARGEAIGVKLPFAAKSGDKVFLWKERSDEL